MISPIFGKQGINQGKDGLSSGDTQLLTKEEDSDPHGLGCWRRGWLVDPDWIVDHLDTLKENKEWASKNFIEILKWDNNYVALQLKEYTYQEDSIKESTGRKEPEAVH